MSAHIVPVSLYYRVFAALLFLTALTTAAAYVDMGPMSNVVAIGIAAIKASLVACFFMHLTSGKSLVRVYAFLGILFLLILFAFTFGDYVSRAWQEAPLGWMDSRTKSSPSRMGTN